MKTPRRGSSQATERDLLVGTANPSIGRSALDNTASCPLDKPQTYHTSHQTAFGSPQTQMGTGTRSSQQENSTNEERIGVKPPSKQLGSPDPQIYHLQVAALAFGHL